MSEENLEQEEILETTDTGISEEAPTETPEGEGEPTEAEAQAAAEWSNFSYRVRDEEKEFDEWIRPIVKDEETYKKVQDFYTAQAGIEIAKQERDEVQGKFDTLNSSLETLNRHVNNGDAKSFIDALGLPKKIFIDYAINELKYQELPPEQQREIDSQRAQQHRLHQLETQNVQMQQQFEVEQGQRRALELDHGLNSPDILPYMQEYDSRLGRPGAFRQAVIDRGIFHSQVNGVDMSAQDAINDAIQVYGLRAVGTPNQQNVQAGTQGQSQVHPASKPVIPNIQGRGTSPVKKKPMSIDDIRRIRAERLEANS